MRLLQHKQHVLLDYDLEEIFSYINQQMLLGKHLGLSGTIERMLESGEEKAVKLHTLVRDFQDEIIAQKILKPKAVFQFFPVRARGDSMDVFDSGRKKVLETFTFPRQSDKDQRCLSDFCSPDRDDNIALVVASCADASMLEKANAYKEAGDLLKSHMLQSIALESAEAFIELLHKKIRAMWGFADAADMPMKDLFHAHYRGIRVSFGYPACPRLEDQEILFRLLDVEKKIGVQLTEGYMMEPEASVSAMVFHHPEARYFNISEGDLEAFESGLTSKPACSCCSSR